MANIFELDDDIDLDDDEFCYSEEEFETNEYIKYPQRAIELISKIVSCEKRNIGNSNRINKIDNMLDCELLGALKYIRLTNESQLQMELSNFGKKLYEGKKYKIIKNKALVGIGGKFSAGKSKFINSLLKTYELLPENQNPTTSIATYIVHGENRNIKLYTNDNRACDIDLEALNALTHSFYEKYNIGFTSFVDCVIVQDSKMPYQDIVFMDTPGYSKADSFEGLENLSNISDREKAKNQLSGVDYLIWLVDIENGEISTADINFLRSLKIASSVLVVLNKADKKTKSDIKKTIAKVENTLQSSGIDYFGVTAYSSLTGEEWESNKIDVFLNQISNEKRSKIDIRLKLKEIEEKIEKEINDKLENCKQENKDLFDIIEKSENVIEIKSLVDLYGDSLKEYRQILLCKILHERNVDKIEREINQHYEE